MEEFAKIPGLLIHIHSLEVRGTATPTAMRTLAIQACSMMGLSDLEPELVRMSPWWCLPRRAKTNTMGRPLRMIDMGEDQTLGSGKPPVEMGAIMGWNIGIVADNQLPPHIILVRCRGEVDRYIMGVLKHQTYAEVKDGGGDLICPRCGESTPMPGDNLPGVMPAPWKCKNKWCGYFPAGTYPGGGDPGPGCQTIPLTYLGCYMPVPPPTRSVPVEEVSGPGLINISDLEGNSEMVGPEVAARRLWQNYIEHSMEEMSISSYREMVVREVMSRSGISDHSKNALIAQFDHLASEAGITDGQTAGETTTPPSSRRSRGRGRKWWRGVDR